MLTFISRKSVAIGEAMIELAALGDDTYKRGFAGDTFNTAWQMSQIFGGDRSVGFVTKVGTDKVSEAFFKQLEEDGLDIAGIGRVTDRTMGLYMIDLDGVERSFQYWRSESAARLLADDQEWLASALEGVGLIHLSGITLAILSSAARVRLWNVLTDARSRGARVSFDPNVRPRLWTSEDEIRTAMSRFNEIVDIALPSFDDEESLWGDRSLEMTIARLQTAGVSEIVVKNGDGAVTAMSGGQQIVVETPDVTGIRDTSGAGDAFNAGYLAGRLSGQDQLAAIACGQKVSGEVIRHFGARIPKERAGMFRNLVC